MYIRILQKQRSLVRVAFLFVIDRKYAVSGAQYTAVFLQALEISFTEWKNKNLNLENANGDMCTPEGDCN
jgi:predicted DsbA family dithiol-disulfide isomerase